MRIFVLSNQNNDMTQDEIKMVLDEHGKWVADSDTGTRANLSGANLSRADLSVANLYGADLYGADLYGADLSRADLSRANLSRADLSRANLYGANLSGADLSRANLSGADLSRADLSGAKGVYCFGPMPTSGRICIAVWAENKWLVKAGCFWGDLDQLEEKVKDDHNCPIYLANIQLLRNWTYE